MPDVSGLDIQRSITNGEPRWPIIFISGKNDIDASVTAMKNGAVDFLVKPFTNEELLQTVKEALKKDHFARSKRDQELELKRRFLQLTLREREIFSHIVLGKLNKQIAADLGIAEKTVKAHRARVRKKMGARNLAELVHFAEVLRSKDVTSDRQDDKATLNLGGNGVVCAG